jgi:hypothetical protein
MKFTREQKKEAYQKLSPKIQDFVMDNETTELISSFFDEIGFSEEQSNDADLEILFTMYGMQTLSEAINSIANLSGKNAEQLAGLKVKLEDNIFKNIDKLKNEPVISETQQVEEIEPKLETPTQPQNNVGNSFEQIILNQAKAMRPAAPANLPTADIEEKPKAIHNYVPGADPYREPIEN